MRLTRRIGAFLYRIYKKHPFLNATIFFLVLVLLTPNEHTNSHGIRDKNTKAGTPIQVPLTRLVTKRSGAHDVLSFTQSNFLRLSGETIASKMLYPIFETTTTMKNLIINKSVATNDKVTSTKNPHKNTQGLVTAFSTVGTMNATHAPDGLQSMKQMSKLRTLVFDNTRRSWNPWARVASCEKFKIRFLLPNSLPMTGLVSYPGSGNTWMRYLLEVSTGIFTGSEYTDSFLFKSGFLGETEDASVGTTVVQKTHRFEDGCLARFGGRAILLLRNPYDAVLAYHNFLFGSHKLYASVLNFRRRDWDSFLHIQLKNWLETLIQWVTKGSSIHVVHYESLKEDPTREVLKAIQFLRIPVDPDRTFCLKDSVTGRVQRKPQYLSGDILVFSNRTRDKFDRVIRYSEYFLKKHNLAPPPTNLYHFYNNTLPDKFIRVPCEENERRTDCDARVDYMNKKQASNWHYRNDVKDSVALINAPGLLNLGMKEGVQGPKAVFINETNVEVTVPFSMEEVTMLANESIKKEKRSNKKVMKELSKTWFGPLASSLLQKMGSSFVEDPAAKLVKDPERKRFLTKSLHFDGAHGQEAEKLAKDFNWLLQGKNKLR